MTTVRDEKTISELISKLREQEEVIRDLIRDRIETEKYWFNLMIESQKTNSSEP